MVVELEVCRVVQGFFWSLIQQALRRKTSPAKETWLQSVPPRCRSVPASYNAQMSSPRTRQLFLASSGILLLGCSGFLGKSGPPRPENGVVAWAVTAEHGEDAASLAQALEEHKEAGLSSHGDYPKLVSGDTIYGLDPASHYVLVAVASEREVADVLSTHISEMSLPAMVTEVVVAEPEDLRLFVVEEAVVSWLSDEWEEELLAADGYNLGLIPADRDNWTCDYHEVSIAGRSGSGADQRVVIPYVLDNEGSRPCLHVWKPRERDTIMCQTTEMSGFEAGEYPDPSERIIRVDKAIGYCFEMNEG